MTDSFDERYWERHYASDTTEARDVARVNTHVVDAAGDLAPGRALDVGCGEGGDALWLASRGWQVTAVDVSAAVLDRARRHAAAAEPDVRDRVEWVRADLAQWPPQREDGYHLVSVQYVHVPSDRLTELAAHLRDAVAPGGTLVVADHVHGPGGHPLTEAVLSTLPSTGWTVRTRTQSTRSRTDDTHPDGHAHPGAPDQVVMAVRGYPEPGGLFDPAER